MDSSITSICSWRIACELTRAVVSETTTAFQTYLLRGMHMQSESINSPWFLGPLVTY